MTLTLAEDGAERIGSALTASEVDSVASLFRISDRPGARLDERQLASIAPLLIPTGPLGSVANKYGEGLMRPVRAILLDKSPVTNWSLAWHQDRVIAVQERHETPGFTNWSIKHGLIHVQAPNELMSGMLTMRIHVDPVDEGNAPLLILRGSHRLGRLSESQIEALRQRLPQAACFADSGDVWIYSTPIVHASDGQRHEGRRRVLQIDFASSNLPGRLRWAYANLH